MQVVHKLPGQPPTIVEVATSLEALQALVGGYIERVPRYTPFASRWVLGEAIVVVNEEALMMGLPPNVNAGTGVNALLGVLRGPLFVCTDWSDPDGSHGEFRGLTDAQAAEVVAILKEQSV